jgi:hypothetical protein
MKLAAGIDQIRNAGFGELAELAQVGFMLEHSRGESSIGRIGGLPRLPEGAVWPSTRYVTGEPWPLTFIAEFELAEPTQRLGPARGPAA